MVPPLVVLVVLWWCSPLVVRIRLVEARRLRSARQGQRFRGGNSRHARSRASCRPGDIAPCSPSTQRAVCGGRALPPHHRRTRRRARHQGGIPGVLVVPATQLPVPNGVSQYELPAEATVDVEIVGNEIRHHQRTHETAPPSCRDRRHQRPERRRYHRRIGARQLGSRQPIRLHHRGRLPLAGMRCAAMRSSLRVAIDLWRVASATCSSRSAGIPPGSGWPMRRTCATHAISWTSEWTCRGAPPGSPIPTGL